MRSKIKGDEVVFSIAADRVRTERDSPGPISSAIAP
jgi:hypothetical protein